MLRTPMRTLAAACVVITLALCAGDARADITSEIADNVAKGVNAGGNAATIWVLIGMCAWLAYRERAARIELAAVNKTAQDLALQTVSLLKDMRK